MKRRAISYSPEATLRKMTLDGIRFFRSEFPAGSSFTYMYFQDSPYHQIASTHYQSLGKMTGGGFTHLADWYSREDNSVIPYGPFTLTAETLSVRWCCVGLADNEPTDYVTLLRKPQGDLIDLNEGDNLLILKGRLTTPSGPVSEGQHVKASKPVSLFCAQDVVMYHWNTAEVQLRYSHDPLANAKAQRWELIKGLRNIRDTSGFRYLDKWFDSDTAARRNISDAVQIASLAANYTVEWTLADDSSILLNAEQVKGMGIALGTHVNQNHQISKNLRSQIMAATTLQEVEGVRWP
jgi:hypothetical protein